MTSILPPIEVMATWPPPNFVNPESRAALMLACEVPVVTLTVITVALRLISRTFLTVGRINIDDIMIILAAGSGIALTVVSLLAIKYGWGLHAWDIELDWIVPAQKLAYGLEVTFVFSIVFTKLSIISFYLRVFSAYVAFRRLAWIGAAFMIAWMIGCVLTVIFQCTPIHAFWDLFVAGAKCVDMYTAIMAASVLNSVSDVYLFMIPIRWVWRLQLPKKQRVGLVVAFGLGLIVCIAGFVRLHYLKLMLHDSYDITWHGASLYISTVVEVNVGIICANLPLLKPLFVGVTGGFTTTHQNSIPPPVWSNYSLPGPTASVVGVAYSTKSRNASCSTSGGGRKYSVHTENVEMMPSGKRRSSFAMRWHMANSRAVNEIDRTGRQARGISVQVTYVTDVEDEEAQLFSIAKDGDDESPGVQEEIREVQSNKRDGKVFQDGSWLV